MDLYPWVEFLKNGLSEDNKIIHAYRGTIGLANLWDMTSLAAFGRLQNAIKYCTKVHKTGPAGQRVE